VTSSTPVRNRQAIVADLRSWLRGLHGGDLYGLPVFGTTDRDEIDLRLAGALYAFALLHRVDDKGRCDATPQRIRSTARGSSGYRPLRSQGA
jgi:hypothetical protein